MLAPKFYYHLTQQTWPERITLYPQIDGEHRSDDEPEVCRTCVAPTVEGCLIALGQCLYGCREVSIYRTVNKVKARNPYQVYDSYLTKEKWLMKPIRFMKVGFINEFLPQSVRHFCPGDYKATPNQEMCLRELKNLKGKFITWI